MTNIDVDTLTQQATQHEGASPTWRGQANVKMVVKHGGDRPT